MDRRDQARPSLVDVRASWDERQTKHGGGVVSTSRRETRGHSGVAWQHAPGTTPPSHHSSDHWEAGSHRSPGSHEPACSFGIRILLHFGSSRCDPPRALRPPLSAVARHSGPSAQVSDRGPETRSGLFHAVCQQQRTLYQESGTACLWAPTHGTRCETRSPRLSFPPVQAVGRPSNLHDEQDCQATQTLLSRVSNHRLPTDAVQEVMVNLHDLVSMPSLTMIKPPCSVSPCPEPSAMEDARNVPSRSARLQIFLGDIISSCKCSVG